MLFRVDSASPASLADQIATQVRSGVVSGALTPGERLPAARDLAVALRVNMHTVLRAYTTLRDEGAIELRRGRGAVVTAKGLDTAELEQSARHLLDVGRRHGVTLAQLHTLLDQEASS